MDCGLCSSSIIVGRRGGTPNFFPRNIESISLPLWFSFSTVYFISSIFTVGMLPRHRLRFHSTASSTCPIHLDNHNHYNLHNASHSALYLIDRYLIKLSKGQAQHKHVDRSYTPGSWSVRNWTWGTRQCLWSPAVVCLLQMWALDTCEGDIVHHHTVEEVWPNPLISWISAAAQVLEPWGDSVCPRTPGLPQWQPTLCADHRKKAQFWSGFF